MSRFEYHADSSASREAVWAILVDHEHMSRWLTRVWRSRLVTAGRHDRNGVGAVRSVITLAGPVREQVLTAVPPALLEYRMSSPNPVVRHYRGAVRLTDPSGGGTHIDWTLAFVPWPELTRVPVERLVWFSTSHAASDLARAADAQRRAAAAP